jgi:hypothetical protein
VVALIRMGLSIFPKKHFRQTAQGNGANQNCQSDQVPTVASQGDDAETVQQSDECHHQEEGAGYVTVHAVPIMTSAAVQTMVRQLPRNPGVPVMTIAMAGSQNTAKARDGLEKMSGDLQVVVPGSRGLSSLHV